MAYCREPELKKLSRYRFVITILWIGFLLAIGFVETPLRFRPEQISLVEALSIGHLVFHALNISELLFAALLVILTFLPGTVPVTKAQRIHLAVAGTILLVQTILLFTILDQRTLAIIDGQEVPPANYHTWYVGLDLVKLVLLTGLAALQIRQFENNAQNSSTGSPQKDQ